LESNRKYRWGSYPTQWNRAIYRSIVETARDELCISQKAVENLDNLLGKVGIEPSQSTLRTEKCMERGLVTDSEAIQYTTVSLSFNIEVSDSFGGYVRLLHMDITIRTMAFAHWSRIWFYV